MQSTREKHRISMKLFFLPHFDRVNSIKNEKSDTGSIIS